MFNRDRNIIVSRAKQPYDVTNSEIMTPQQQNDFTFPNRRTYPDNKRIIN